MKYKLRDVGIATFVLLVVALGVLLAQNKSDLPVQPFGKLTPSDTPISRAKPVSPIHEFGRIKGLSPPVGKAIARDPRTSFGKFTNQPTPTQTVKPNFPFPSFGQLNRMNTPMEKRVSGSPTQSFQQLATLSAPNEKGQIVPNLPTFANLPSVGVPSSVYRTFRLSDFSGGLNKIDFPTEIADKEVTELVNFVWEGKRLVPRDGFTLYAASEFAPAKRIWGLYPYYKRDGSKILLAGVDDTLYADTNLSGSFVAVKGGLQANGKYYHFDTFRDKAIVAHEGDYPFWYDGDSVRNLGVIATGKMLKAKSSTACSAGGDWTTEAWFTISPNASVENDDLVAYTVGFTCASVAGGWMYEFITKYRHGIGEDTVFIPSVAVCWPDTTKTFKIMVNFSKGVPVDSGVIDSSDLVRPGAVPNCGYWFKVFDLDKSWSSDQYVRYIIEAKDREKYESYTRYIQGNASNRLYLGYYTTEQADTSDFPFQKGMEYRIRKLDFHIARLVKTYKNRIFLVAREQDPELKERIIFSKFNNLNDFPPDNYIPLNFKQSEYVTALATFYEDQLGYKDQSKDCLVIFTNNSIYKLIFSSDTDRYLVQVVEGIGCVAPQSVVNVEGKYLLFLHTTGVYVFDGRTVTLVSGKIDPIIENMGDNLAEVAGGYYNRHYYLTYPQNVLFEGFEDTSTWGLGGAGASKDDDTVNYREGQQSIKLTSANGVKAQLVKSNTNIDLSKVDNVIFWVYVWDVSKLDSLRIVLATELWGKWFYKWFITGTIRGAGYFKDGWNRFVIPKSAFGVSGDASWDDPILGLEVDVISISGENASVSFDDWRMGYNTRPKCILTFDDGHESVYRNAKPIMDANNQSGVAFVITTIVGFTDCMTKSELTEMYATGWDISNHTCCHDSLTGLSQADMELHVDSGYDWLVDNGFEESAKFFCYPIGAYNDSVLAKVAERHVLARSVIKGEGYQPHFQLGDDNIDLLIKRTGVGASEAVDAINWIDYTIESGGLSVFMFHKIVDSNATGGTEYNVDDFQALSNYLRSRDDEIDVITFSDYYRGISEWGRDYNSLVFNVDLGSWGKTDLRAGIFAKQTSIDKKGKLLFSTPDHNSFIYEFGTSEQDTGESIFLSLQSKAFNLGDLHKKKRFIYFDMDYYLNADSVNAYFYTDFGNTLRYSSKFDDAGGYRHARMPLNMDCLGRNFSFKLTSNKWFELGGVALKFREMGE